MPEEEDPVVQLFTQNGGRIAGGNEGRASDILRNNYSALSQSITEPVRVAEWLRCVISDEVLSYIKSISTRGSVSDSRAVLLKAVRDAVHSNYKHLELFVTVLRKFSETAPIGDTIFEEYSKLSFILGVNFFLGKHFSYYDDDVKESEIYLAKRPQEKSMSTSSESILYSNNYYDNF